MYPKAKDLDQLTQEIEAILKKIASTETRNLNNKAYINALIRLQLVAGKKVQLNLGED